jgi:hypothetical protein
MQDQPCVPFVVGVARSGTTLLRLMLDAHPELAIPPETHFAGRVIRAFGPGGGGSEQALDAMVSSPFWSDFGISAAELRRTAADLSQEGPGLLLRCFYEAYADRFDKPRWGDKTPPYLDQMLSIQQALPEACFIHVIRDGRDVALSIMPLWFGPNTVEDAARQWTNRIAGARKQASELDRYAEVRYEDLVRDPAATLRRLCDLLALPWDKAMLDYHRSAERRLTEMAGDLQWRDGRTIPGSTRLSMHALASRPPQAQRLERWRSEMTPADRAAFVAIAGGRLEELGYELT